MKEPARRFPPPWTLEKTAESFCVCDANCRALVFRGRDRPAHGWRSKRRVAILEHHSVKRRASQDEEAPTDERSGLGLPNHLVPLCVWDSGVNGSVLGKA
jgi:hypothetical protein